MVREFTLPDVGEGVAEGELVSWLVEEGDTVTEDQPVAEVETDKALVEVPSPVDGTVRELRAEAGETVPVGEVLLTFDVKGEEPPETETELQAEQASQPAEPAETPEAANDSTDEAAEAGDPGALGADADEESAMQEHTFAPPRVRRLAREAGVDLSSVRGSGTAGRVTEADVRAVTEGDAAVDEADAEATDAARSHASEASGESPTATESADRERTLAAPATRRLAAEEGVDVDAVPAAEERDGEAFVTPEAVREYAAARREASEADRELDAAKPREREERAPYRGIRRRIGEQMERSAYTAPQVTHFDEVDVTELVETRSRLRERADGRGIRLTYVPFVLKAVVAALQAHPLLNSQLDEGTEEIVKLGYYNVGVAVATDEGLLVPVVEDVDRKGLLQIAAEVNELIQRARNRSITVEEMQGGTFTVTNVGAIGGTHATPIVNYPEVGILALGSIEKRPRVVTDEATGEDAIEPRHVLPLSLTFDHRVLDGAVAARFTNTLAEYLEEPELLLLE